MYKGRGSANEKMMRGIPARGKVPAKVEREAQLIFMCLQKKSNKGVRRERQFDRNAAKRASTPTSAESGGKESYGNFRKQRRNLQNSEERKNVVLV